MYNLSKWYLGTPTVPPVGAVNVPSENPKTQKIHIFEDLGGGHFFLIHHIIGFSLKYVIPKSSTDFFFIENKKFFEKITFLHFLSYFISNLWKFHSATPSRSPVREKSSFFPLNFANWLVWRTNFLRQHLRTKTLLWSLSQTNSEPFYCR